MKDADPIFEMYIYESTQMIELTEAIILDCEHHETLSSNDINEIFRYMHTLKGSSSMMGFSYIANIAHALEDMFHMLREKEHIVYSFHDLFEIILEGIDYFKQAIASITENRDNAAVQNSDAEQKLLQRIKQFLQQLDNNALPEKNVKKEYSTAPETSYHAIIHFTDDCQMENVRAYQTIHHLEPFVSKIVHVPNQLIEDEHSCDYIRQHGFKITFQSDAPLNILEQHLQQTAYLKSLHLNALEATDDVSQLADSSQLKPLTSPLTKTTELAGEKRQAEEKQSQGQQLQQNVKSSVVSVPVQKLDRLMDLVGELVIAENMLSSHTTSYEVDSEEMHNSSSRNQLRKITGELQDTIMSIRMVPLAPVFHRMRRVTRDMSHKLQKEIQIELIGEETEIDKSIIDQISDPLMHIVRNAIDHGIETEEKRMKSGKSKVGKVTIEARNIGSDVLLIISDDGQGLDKDTLIAKAIKAGILPAETNGLSERDACQLIFHPGLSTKEEITEFSGRGVGMDVVAKSIEHIGGTIYIESQRHKGTTITIKIPLTLAIIDGMNVMVGASHYTLPTTSIKESFRPRKHHLLSDPDGNQMVMVRGECYPIVSLAGYLNQQCRYIDPCDSILIMLEHESKRFCLQVDELVGQQQVVIKPLPNYFRRFKKLHTFSGCTLLGNGSISMILNLAELTSSHPNYTSN